MPVNDNSNYSSPPGGDPIGMELFDINALFSTTVPPRIGCYQSTGGPFGILIEILTEN
jgi:hypothetical protein